MKKSILILLAVVLIGMLSLVAMTACTKEANIDHLEIYSAPKTTYYLGEAFDLNGAKILVVYVDNTEKLVDVSPSMISDFDSSVLGTQYIKIYYGNSSVTVMVEVVRRMVSTVELEIPPENYDHVQGQNLKTEGSYLVVTYTDGKVDTIPVTEDMCSGYDRDRVGQQSVTVSAQIDGEAVTSTYAVNVREREISRIEITAAPSRNVYYLGDSEVDLNGGELFVTYNNGYSERFRMISAGSVLDGLRVVSFDSSAVSARVPVTVEYNGFTASYYVSVQERNVDSYEFVTPVPEQLQGTPFNWGDAEIRITYTNGEVITVSLPDERYVKLSGYVPGTAGEQSLTLNFVYGEALLQKQDVLVVTVNARSLIGLEIVDAPVVYESTVFDISEFTYRYVYDNGEYGEPAPLTESMVVWQGGVVTDVYDEPGTVTWLIRQSNIDYEYSFEVAALQVTDILFHTEADGGVIAVVYRGTDEISYGDLEISVVYNSGAVERAAAGDIASLHNGSFELLFDESSALGYSTAEFVFRNDYSADGFVKEAGIIIARAVAAVNVTAGDSFRRATSLGTAFDPDGLRIDVTYTDGGSESFEVFDEVFYNAWSFVPEAGSPEYEIGYNGEISELVFKETGTYVLTLSNRGISESTVFGGESIIIAVTNAPAYIAGMFRDENGLDEIDPDNASEFSVPTGASIDLGGVWIEIVYEGIADGVNLRDFVSMTDPRVAIDYSARDNLAPGTVIVPYSYAEGGVVLADPDKYYFTVTVKARNLVAIEADVSGMDTEYVSGEGLNFTGLKVNLVYDNGTRQALADINSAIQNGTLSYSGYNSSVTGSQTVTLTYTYYEIVEGNTYTYSLSTTFRVNVSAPVPQAVRWTSGTVPETELFGGAPFVLERVYVVTASGYGTRLIDEYVTVTFTDGSSVPTLLSDILRDVSVDESTFNLSTPGKQSPVLIYKGCKFNISLTIPDRELIAISLNVGNISVVQEAEIDLRGLTLNLQFSDDTFAQIPLEQRYIAFSAENENGYDSSNTLVGERTVTVFYEYEGTRLETSVKVTVTAKQLVKIEINGLPPKQFYIEGEPFEVSHSDTVRIHYSNGLSEVIPLTEATVLDGTLGETAGPFNIRLNNSALFDDNFEISDNVTRTQRIEIDYTYSGVTAQTSYLIYMRDRRTPTVTYNPNNVYERTYKDENMDLGIALSFMGYDDYDTFGKTFTEGDGTSGTYGIYYIGVDGTPYDTVPVAAGTYTIAVYYEGDAIHNEFIDTSYSLVIKKRPLTVTFDIKPINYGDLTVYGKIYGQATPPVYITAAGFAEGEGFDDIYASPEHYATVAFVPDGNGGMEEVDYFSFAYFKGAEIAEMNERASAGTYSIMFVQRSDSENYNITYLTQNYTVAQRKIVVTTDNVSATYGAVEPVIPVYVSAAEEFDESGLVNDDVLKGSLLRENYNSNFDAGKYLIIADNLINNNPNYSIIFSNSAADEDTKWFTIMPRTLYVQVGSSSQIYGDAYVAPSISYFGDAACTESSSAFASIDSALAPAQIVGEFAFVYPAINGDNGYMSESGEYLPYYRTPVGTYAVSARISKEGERLSNYDVRIVDGRLAITARSLKVTAEAASKKYGEADPVFGYSVELFGASSGLVEGDVLTGALSRAAGEAVGEYAISLNTLSNPNYSVTFVSARFNIVKRELKLSISDGGLSKVYDGKVPSVDTTFVTLFESDGVTAFEGTQVGIAGAESREDVLKNLKVSFENASKNVGSYKVTVSMSGANYSVGTVEEYTFFITEYVVPAQEINYYITVGGVALAFGSAAPEYSGTAYQLSASILNPMPVYNSDGTQATDNLNRPRYDSVFVQLNVTQLTDAGDYTIYATGFDTSNYALDPEDDYSAAITVKSKEVVVTMLNVDSNPEYPDTVVREYGENSLLIYGLDYVTSVDDLYESLPFDFELGVFSNGMPMEVSDVYFDDNGDPMVYPIGITILSSGNNFNIVLAEDYKFVMLQRSIVINIFDSALSKKYDGLAPSISLTQFSQEDMFVGFDASTVQFEFTRIASDGRSGSSVGEYTISASCTDSNFKLSTLVPYIYTIQPVEVKFSLFANALEKYYDGVDIEFVLNDINFGTSFSSQNAPSIRTYAYGNVYNSATGGWLFSENLTAIGDSLSLVRSAFEEIDLGLATAKSYLTRTRTLLTSFAALLEQKNQFLTYENYVAMSDAVTQLGGYLGSLSEALDASDANGAANAYASAQNALTSIVELYLDENSYIAFVVGKEGVYSITDVTSNDGYPVVAVANDYNINFVMSNQNPKVSIRPRRFTVYVPSVTVEYGSGEQPIEYNIFDPTSGTYLVKVEEGVYRYENDNGTLLYIRGEPIRTPGNNRGEYDIFISGINIYNGPDSEEISTNYLLIAGQGDGYGKYIITRAQLTLSFGTITSGLYYGDPISHSTVYSLVKDKFKVSGGGLAAGDELKSVVNFSDISFVCLGADGVTNLIGTTATVAGDRVLTATLPASASQNYTVTIEPGVLTINKRTLGLSYAIIGTDRVEKTYGEELTMDWFLENLSYTGFVLNDTVQSVFGTDKLGNRTSLAEIVWPYIAMYYNEQGELVDSDVDPLSAEAHVAATANGPLYVLFSNTDEYEFDNYVLNFNDTAIAVTIVPKTLKLSVIPSSGSTIKTYYMGTPPESSYRFDFWGYVNGDTDEDFGVGPGQENAPSLKALKTGDVFYNAGKVVLGDANVDYEKAANALTDYTIDVDSFIVEIEAIPISVKLSGDINVLYVSGGYQLQPYTITYGYTTVKTTNQGESGYVEDPNGSTPIFIIDESSMALSGGQYGAGDFEFALGIDSETLKLHGIDVGSSDEFINALKALTVKYNKADMDSLKKTAAGTYSDGMEYYDYTNLYVHSVTKGTPVRNSDGSYSATCSLANMQMNSSNYKLVYESFSVNVVTAVVAIISSFEESLIESDIADYIVNGNISDELRKLIYFYATNARLENEAFYGSGDPQDTAFSSVDDGIILEIVSGTEYKSNVTYLVKLYYDKQAVLDTSIGSVDLQYMTYQSSGNGSYVAVIKNATLSDSRQLEYSSDDVYNFISMRFRNTYTVSEINPSLTGMSYGLARTSAGENGYFTSKTLGAYDAGYFEIRANAAADPSASVVRLLINGTNRDGLYITFDSDSYNSLSLEYYSGGVLKDAVRYNVNYGWFFDGAIHKIRFELSKDAYTFIASVDGYTGALIRLNNLFDAFALGTEASVAPFNEDSSGGIRFCATNLVFRRAEYYTVGRYSDKRGILVTLKDNSSPIVVSGGTSDYFELSGVNISNLFGLPYEEVISGGVSSYFVPKGYSYVFYVDGTQYDFDSLSNVKLSCGRHLIEVALYTGETLVDTDSLTLDVVSAVNTDGVYLIRYNSQGETDDDVIDDSLFTGPVAMELYDKDPLYHGAGDKELVRPTISENYYAYVLFPQNVVANYISMSFKPERTAITTASDAYYPAYPSGETMLNFNLFRLVTDASNIYDGVNLVFTLVQAQDQNIGTGGEYTLSARLYYTVDGLISGNPIAELYSATLTADAPVFSLTAYIDRNSADYFGTGNMIVTLGTDDTFAAVQIADDSVSARLGDDSMTGPSAGYITITTATYARITFYDVVCGKGLPAAGDYVRASGTGYTFVSSAGTATLSNGQRLYLSEDGTKPEALRHNGVTMKFNGAGDGKMRTYLSVNGTDPEAKGSRGIYLEFDFTSGTLTFRFYEVLSELDGGGTRMSAAQSVKLADLFGTVPTEYDLDAYFNTNVKEDYTLMKAVMSRSFGSKAILNASIINPVYYQTVYVTLNGKQIEFYCPLFNDNMVQWLIETESGESFFGASNPYGNMTDFSNVPTFIGYFGFVAAEYTGNSSVTVEEFKAYLGSDNSDTDSAITETPAI